jgi:hypothetical protein
MIQLLICYTGETTILAALDAVGAATNSNLVVSTGTTAATYLTATGDIFSEAVAGADASGKGIDHYRSKELLLVHLMVLCK